MDFFEYASIAFQFVNTNTWYVPFIVGGICFLIVFVFQSAGLYVIAGHEGYKNRWMAFVPFLNTYYIGVCAQKNRTFKSVDTRYFALAAAILEALLFAGYTVLYVAQFKLLYAGCVEDVVVEGMYGIQNIEYRLVNLTPDLYWAAWCFECLNKYILTWVDLAFLVLQVFILSAFFQTFAARRYFLFTITSVLFPVQGILIFILRNNKGMNYRDFIRKEQERQYKMYQQYARQNFESNPYNQNPYSRGGYGGDPYGGEFGGQTSNVGQNNQTGASSPDDPFSGLGQDGGDDPFQN